MNVFQLQGRRRPPATHVYGRRRNKTYRQDVNEDDDEGSGRESLDPLGPSTPSRQIKRARVAEMQNSQSPSPPTSAGPRTPSTPRYERKGGQVKSPQTPSSSTASQNNAKLDCDITRMFSRSFVRSSTASGSRGIGSSPLTPTKSKRWRVAGSHDDDNMSASSSLTTSPYKAVHSTFAKRMAPRCKDDKRLETESTSIDLSGRSLVKDDVRREDYRHTLAETAGSLDSAMAPTFAQVELVRERSTRRKGRVKDEGEESPSKQATRSVQDLQTQWQDLDHSSGSDAESPLLTSASGLLSSGELFQFELDLAALLGDLDVANTRALQRAASRRLTLRAQGVDEEDDSQHLSNSVGFAAKLLQADKVDELLRNMKEVCSQRPADLRLFGDFADTIAYLIKHRPAAISLVKKTVFLQILDALICCPKESNFPGYSSQDLVAEGSSALHGDMRRAPALTAAGTLFALLEMQSRRGEDPNDVMSSALGTDATSHASLRDTVSQLIAGRAAAFDSLQCDEADKDVAVIILACMTLCAKSFKDSPDVLRDSVCLLMTSHAARSGAMNAATNVPLAHAALQFIVATTEVDASTSLQVLCNCDIIETLVRHVLAISTAATLDTLDAQPRLHLVDSSTLALGLLIRLAEAQPGSFIKLLTSCTIDFWPDNETQQKVVTTQNALTQISATIMNPQKDAAETIEHLRHYLAAFLAIVIIGESAIPEGEKSALSQIAQGLGVVGNAEAISALLRLLGKSSESQVTPKTKYCAANGSARPLQSANTSDVNMLQDLSRQLETLRDNLAILA